MFNKKHSFLERISGSASTHSQDNDSFDDDLPQEARDDSEIPMAPDTQMIETDADAGQLPVDVFQMPDAIVIHAFVAGVRPDELNVSISRDMVVIKGTRAERQQITDSDYFTRELFWGSFARTILLPQEIDSDSSTAHSKDGLLIISLPKVDRTHQTKIRVKAG